MLSKPLSSELSRPGSVLRRIYLSLVLAVMMMVTSGDSANAIDEGQYKTGDGIAAYLGFLPAAMAKGHPRMHGGPPRGPHAYHLVVAIFDAANGERISDAKVTAHVGALGLAAQDKLLEPMDIAGTVTYGTFLTLPNTDRYTVLLRIERPGARKPAVIDFSYDHRSR